MPSSSTRDAVRTVAAVSESWSYMSRDHCMNCAITFCTSAMEALRVTETKLERSVKKYQCESSPMAEYADSVPADAARQRMISKMTMPTIIN
eukprot:scaffold29085_cov112-Isochrysis_galbana.AAC.3